MCTGKDTIHTLVGLISQYVLILMIPEAFEEK